MLDLYDMFMQLWYIDQATFIMQTISEKMNYYSGYNIWGAKMKRNI